MDSLSEAVSFGSLYQRYEHDMKRWVGKRTHGMPNEEIFAGEVLQQARIRIWNRWNSYDPNAPDALPERAWVYCQTRDAFVELWRSERKGKRENVAAGHFESWIAAPGESQIVESLTGPLTKLARQEAASRAVELLKQLRTSDRENITMRNMDGLSFHEIGVLMETSEAAARKKHFDAIRRFQKLWNSEFPDSQIGNV